ncbi:chaperone [Carex rostrata]
MENLTASEIAGFGVGALLLCATLAAPKLDSFIALSQRRSLGMCKRCGDLKMIACSNCKGTGSIRKGSNFFSNMVDDFYESMEDTPKQTPMEPCVKCQSKGRTACPECSVATRVI